MSEKFQKFILLSVGVLAMSILVGYLVFAWTEPSASPPGGNAPAPINVGPQGQAKEGGLILNTGGAPIGLIVQNGNVGIGTTDVTAKLTIQNLDINQASLLIKQLVPEKFGFLKTIGGPDSDLGYFVRQTVDGGYIIVGYTSSFGTGSVDIFVIKLDYSGNLSWAETIGRANVADYGYSIQQTSDGGYIIVGGGGEILVVKLNSSGELVWAKTIGVGNYTAKGYSIQQTSDGGYIIVGEASINSNDVVVVKLNSSGDLVWAKTIGGNQSYEIGRSIQQTSDGGYIIVGDTTIGAYNIFVIKLDSSGNLSWAGTIGGSGYNYGRSIQQTSDGGYIIVGYNWWAFGSTNYNIFIIKLYSSGVLAWAETIDGWGDEQGFSIQQISDGGYVMTGDCSGTACVIKLNSSGGLVWAKVISGGNSRSIQQTSDGGFVITGYRYYPERDYNIFIAKLDSSGGISGCQYVYPVSLTVQIVSPTFSFVSPTVSSWSPTVSSISPTVSFPTPTVSSQCFASPIVPSFIVTPDGKVGIGTANPAYKLDVEGYAQAYGYYTGDIIFQSGKENLWRLSEDKTNLYLQNLRTGENFLTIDENGNLGIGTANPSQRLEINGGIRLNASIPKPICDESTRGTLWFTKGKEGEKDSLEACLRDESGNYRWIKIY